MKIIITESQLKTITFQNTVDMSFDDIKKKCNKMNELGADAPEIISFDVCDQIESISKVEVVNVYKTNNMIEISIIVYYETIFQSLDVGGFLYELEYHLRDYLGKGNFKLKLLNSINTREDFNW
jgi:hypothetical protein